jgi:endonuclease YncB( thermonuclease family)
MFTPILLFAQEKVKLNKVIDGDTIKIERSGKKESVRFIGVDMPESRKNKKAKIRKRLIFLPVGRPAGVVVIAARYKV